MKALSGRSEAGATQLKRLHAQAKRQAACRAEIREWVDRNQHSVDWSISVSYDPATGAGFDDYRVTLHDNPRLVDWPVWAKGARQWVTLDIDGCETRPHRSFGGLVRTMRSWPAE